MGVVLPGQTQRLGAVFGRIDLVPFALEVVTDEFEDVHFVVGYQDAVFHGRGVWLGQVAVRTFREHLPQRCAGVGRAGRRGQSSAKVRKFPGKTFGGTGKMVIFA